MDQDASWYLVCTEVGLGPHDIVLDGDRDPAASPKRGTAALNFLVHVYCGQTAGKIKMPFATESGPILRFAPHELHVASMPVNGSEGIKADSSTPNFTPLMQGWGVAS